LQTVVGTEKGALFPVNHSGRSSYKSIQLPRISTVLYCILLTLTTTASFFYHQLKGYYAFCSGPADPAEWCTNSIPSIYSHVQSKYWNSGLFKYWTVSQSPNILMGLPPLILIMAFSIYHLKEAMKPAQGPFSSLDLTPHAIHGLVLAAILLFASHTQIALRIAASLPLTYWGAAWLVLEYPTLATWWVGWSMTWGVLSMILWAAFLPPA
jgi:phosphatidylinositol glycan class V